MTSDKTPAQLENNANADKTSHKPVHPLAPEASGQTSVDHARAGYTRAPLPRHVPDIYAKPRPAESAHSASPPEKPTPLPPAHDAASVKAVGAIHNAAAWVSGFGDREAVYKALGGKSEAQIRDMKALYQDKYKMSLRDGIKTDINIPVVGDYLGSMEKADAILNHKDKVSLPSERTHLENSAKAKLPPAEQKELNDNMAKLEARRSVNKISDEEVARTYREVSKLLDAKGNRPLHDDERNKLALEVMHHAGTPTSIYQGIHNTCSMNSVETASYMNAPSQAARVVTDVALTGRYIDRNGVTIINSPEPRTAESRTYPMLGGGRTHASEIFQITAANLMYKQEGIHRSYDQIKLPPNHAAGDNGERVYDTSKQPPQVVYQANGIPFNSPGIGPQQFGMLASLTRTITGQDRVSAAVAAGWLQGHHDARVQSIASEQQLEQSVAQAKKDGKLPMLVHIDTDTEPFFSNCNSPRGGGKHVLTVTDYTPAAHGKPAQLNVDSNWGDNTNYLGARKLDLHDLYVAMQPPDTAPTLIASEVAVERKQSKFDIGKETELLRLQSEHQKVDQAQYSREFLVVENAALKHLQDAKEGDREMIKSKLLIASRDLPVNLQLKTLDTLKSHKVISDGEYNAGIARVWSVELDKLKDRNPQDLASFKDYISGLPKGQQVKLREQARKFGIQLTEDAHHS